MALTMYIFKINSTTHIRQDIFFILKCKSDEYTTSFSKEFIYMFKDDKTVKFIDNLTVLFVYYL